MVEIAVDDVVVAECAVIVVVVVVADDDDVVAEAEQSTKPNPWTIVLQNDAVLEDYELGELLPKSHPVL